MAAAARQHTRSETTFGLLVPAWLHGLDWAGDPFASVPCAQKQLDTLVGLADAAGLALYDAAVGDPDPVTAIADAVYRSPAEELLICVPAHRMRGPLDLARRARRFTGLPTSRVAVAGAPTASPHWPHRRPRHCVAAAVSG